MRAYQSIIEKMGLMPHPQGGYYRRQWLSKDMVDVKDKSGRILQSDRSIGSAIIYLLPSHEVCAWHRLACDEIWHFYRGSSLKIYFIDSDGCLRVHRLGTDLEMGEFPQFLVPKGSWFCVEVVEHDYYSLCGCTLWPSFSYADYELADPEDILAKYPAYEAQINRLKKKQIKL